MTTFNFKIGDLCEVSSEKGIYMSKVQDVIDDTHYFIDFPSKDGSLEFFHEGDRFSLSVLRSDETGNTSSYKFDALVIGRKILNDNIRIPVLNVKRLSEIEKTQRRNFFRLSYDSPALIEISDESKQLSVQHDATIVDISGGGLKLKTEKRLPSQNGKVLFTLLDLELAIDAEFIGTDFIHDKGHYLTRYKYLDIPNELQEKIVNRLTKIQTEQLKNSMSRYESQRNASIMSEDINQRLDEEAKNISQMSKLKVLCVILAFLTIIFYLFTLPSASYPLDKFFKVGPRVSIVSQFYVYTIISATAGLILTSLGFIWVSAKNLKASANGFFIINFILNSAFLVLAFVNK